MRSPLAATRLAVIAVLVLATSLALGMPAAHGAQSALAPGEPPQPDFEVSISSSPAETDFGRRTVDLAGAVTRADGIPVADAPVQLTKSVLYDTWNPWGDPIDPTERETLSLGTVHTDAEGRFTLSGVTADRWQNEPSIHLFPRHRVEFGALYDPGDPTDHYAFFGDTTVAVQPVTSTLTYKVSRTKVRAGDTLVVVGQVTWPAGHGPVAGTRVLLRTYFESAYNARATTDANGRFAIRVKIRSYDREFVVFSAPGDYYIAGASHVLPVKNVTP
ncbi:acyl carrier protein [Streptomyces monticola]|uniref:Acyl carrier protein n=1 Tax=Streptomyces monticola TaxID=2666263 RepID=A0ABW2JEU2_9ACTN